MVVCLCLFLGVITTNLKQYSTDPIVLPKKPVYFFLFELFDDIEAYIFIFC